MNNHISPKNLTNMKTFKVLFIAIAVIASCTISAQVSVNTDGSSADGSAMLEVKSTDKGFLLPRMTEAQRDAISSPSTGLTIFNTDINCLQWYNGTWWYNKCGDLSEYHRDGTVFCGEPTVVNDVTNPTTGEIWMDRNLGASQVATSSTDADSYGDMYQWGRFSDGHQCRTSGTTSTNATTAVANQGNSWDGLFVIEPVSPNDWLSTQDATLWQGVSGTNNPCPDGYRLPTSTEWEAERQTWSSSNSAGAYASLLKLPCTGRRHEDNAALQYAGSRAFYWSSTVAGSGSRYLYLTSSSAITTQNTSRGRGCTVRCIKD